MERVRLLVSLDELYDTRLTLALDFNSSAMMAYLRERYDKRVCDLELYEALGITREQWLEQWDKRDDTLLRRSTRTRFISLIREMIRDIEQNPRIDQKQLSFELTVNTYPYYLTDEAIDTYKEVIPSLTHPLLKVHFLRRAPDKVTPRWLVSNYNMFALYDFDEWVKYYEDTKEEDRGNLLAITLILPRVLQQMPTEEDLELYKEQIRQVDIFEICEQYNSPFLNLRYEPVGFWNVALDEKQVPRPNVSHPDADRSGVPDFAPPSVQRTPQMSQ